MKTTLYCFCLVCAIAIDARGEINLRKLAHDAISAEPALAQSAIQSLRNHGQKGIDALTGEHASLLQNYGGGGNPRDAVNWERLKAVMQQVGGQKDCHASQLFWFDDLAKAKAEAVRSGKPILSLRMLGKLTEELSCANSRFFRTTLYPNLEVSRFLRENFVLHWESVRPVPKVTIDFGDGRKLERTITGNSIHYILHSDGTPVDALPGLYSAEAFLKALTVSHDAAVRYSKLESAQRGRFLSVYHRGLLDAVSRRKANDVARVGGKLTLQPVQTRTQPNAPDAKRAMNFAVSKGAIEVDVLNATIAGNSLQGKGSIEEQMGDPVWSKVAALYAPEARLDRGSYRLIASKNPSATAASGLTLTKTLSEISLVRMIANLERSIAEDTVRNEYVLRPEIHRWFIAGTSIGNVEELNRRVYSELFLTPDSDPWLGLVPANTFSALQNDGLVIPASWRASSDEAPRFPRRMSP